MKLNTTIAVIGLTTLGLAGYAGGDQESGGLLSKMPWHKEAQVITSDKLTMALTVKDYLDVDVVNMEGERLGRVVDIILEDDSGEFTKLVVAHGSTLGIGGKLVAIPYGKLERRPGTRDFVWDIPKQDFMAIISERETGGQTDESKRYVRERVTERPAETRGAYKQQIEQSERELEAPAKTTVAYTEQTGQAEMTAQIRDALRSDRSLRDQASQIDIRMERNKIVLSGEVNSQEQKDRILEVSRKSTSHEVVDKLKVRD